MRGVFGLVGSWLQLTASIYVAFVLFWAGSAVLQRDQGIPLTLLDTAISVATLSAMQTVLSAIYILPFVPFKKHILKAGLPFVKWAYTSVVIWIILLLSLLWFQAEATLAEVIIDRTFWNAVLQYELIAYLSVVIWGLSSVGWKAILERGKPR